MYTREIVTYKLMNRALYSAPPSMHGNHIIREERRKDGERKERKNIKAEIVDV